MRSQRRGWLFCACAALAGAVLPLSAAHASISYNTDNATYSQNFDTLPNRKISAWVTPPIGWTDDNASPGAGNFSILGWYMFHA